ncbi:MAG: HAMP domain-containing histidine kinase, partial [Nitrosarchaeum sp.]|nr:HAMP domain-containing histidine kinase [Nitrosarchaeum sp.]
LAQAIIILSKKNRRQEAYAPQVRDAFSIYLIGELLLLANIIFLDNAPGRLSLLTYPFPILAILLLFRVTYLKLVDKAMLQERLRKTRRLYESEREAGKLKDEFVDVVSHELRTPLTSISLYAGLLSKTQKLTDKGEDMVRIIKDECRRLTALVNDLLDFSKLEKGHVKPQLAQTNLRELITRALPPHLAEERGLALHIKVLGNISANIDRRLLTQALLNLYSNAVKFTPHGSITITARNIGRSIHIAVKDTGIGIAPEHQSKIFRKFYQASNHLTRTEQGTGLGLAIVRQITDLHKVA